MTLDVCLCLCLLLFMEGVRALAPVIANPTGTATLNQLQATDLCVYQLDITPDAFNCVENITSNPQFSLQKRTGDPDFCVYFLTGQGALVPPSYTVKFTCVDTLDAGMTGEVVIGIIPNNPPTFDKGPSDTETADATAIKTNNILFRVAATDINNDALSYSLDTVLTEMAIDAANGDMIALVDFNTITTATFNFKVSVTDSNSAPVLQDLTINLININTPPQITNIPTPDLAHPESVASGTVLYKCIHDESGPLTITMNVNPITEAGVLAVNSATCEISLVAGKNLDFERQASISLTLILDDGVYTRLFSFTLRVTNVNEPPVFASNSYTMNILEGPVPSTPVIQPAFVVNDPDAGDTTAFSMGTGTYDSYFTIVNTGVLTVVKELDFDAGTTQVTVTVIVADSGSETASTTLTVNVADYNDNAPVFANTNWPMYISPKTPVGKIGQVTATDVDVNASPTLTYSLVSDSSGGKFQVQPDGSVHLNTVVTEAERNDIYTVVVKATDDGTPSLNSDTTVTITFDPPPLLTNLPNAAFLSEDTTGKAEVFLIQVNETDVYSCVAELITPTTTKVAFLIEQKGTGPDWAVFYSGLEPLSSTVSPFKVDVSCTDANNGKSVISRLTINVVQNTPPTMSCIPSKVDVDASTAVVGTKVHTMTATDNDPLTYAITVNPNPTTFKIALNGDITSEKIMIKESVLEYQAVVTASDTFNTASCTVTFAMINQNVAPTFVPGLPRNIDVLEDIVAPATVAVVTITDVAECDPTTYTWDIAPFTDRAKFTTSINNKEITLKMANGQNLDKETTKQYTFTFSANDGCLTSQLFPLYVTVTDVNEKPEFLSGTKYFAFFDEQGTGSTKLGCNGWDPDVGDTHTLVLTGPNSNLFAITDTTNCYISQVLEYDLDKGAPDTFQLTMTMTDKAGLSADATITVTVKEINDNDPICNTPPFVLGDIFNSDTIGRALGQVTAVDDDIGTNGQLTYKVVSPSSGTNVVTCGPDGTFKLIADPEANGLAPGTLLTFSVEAKDGGTPAKTAVCTGSVQYIYTTTPTTPPTTTAATQPTAATTQAAATQAATTTLSPAEQALKNPVILGLIAAMGALLLLGLIIGLSVCCKQFCCKGNPANSTSNAGRYNMNKESYNSSDHNGTRSYSPKSNQVGSKPTTATDITMVNEGKPMHNGPTTLRYVNHM